MSERACICADPENCREPIPGRLCKRFFAVPQPAGDSRPLADVLLVRPDPNPETTALVIDDPSTVRRGLRLAMGALPAPVPRGLGPSSGADDALPVPAPAADSRHGWHCPCVACRIDRGED